MKKEYNIDPRTGKVTTEPVDWDAYLPDPIPYYETDKEDLIILKASDFKRPEDDDLEGGFWGVCFQRANEASKRLHKILHNKRAHIVP